jgi:hypothetical protein
VGLGSLKQEQGGQRRGHPGDARESCATRAQDSGTRLSMRGFERAADSPSVSVPVSVPLARETEAQAARSAQHAGRSTRMWARSRHPRFPTAAKGVSAEACAFQAGAPLNRPSSRTEDRPFRGSSIGCAPIARQRPSLRDDALSPDPYCRRRRRGPATPAFSSRPSSEAGVPPPSPPPPRAEPPRT